MTLAIGHLTKDSVCVLDALLEERPPLNPGAAVARCADLLRRYGVTKVIGDKYAGEWPVAQFAEHGVEFEQSARPKSDLYHDFLPLLNARRVELLEIPGYPRSCVALSGARRAAGRIASTIARAVTTIWPTRSRAFWSASTSTAGSR